MSAVGLWLQVMPPLTAILDSLRSGHRAFLEELQARFETVEPELHAFLPEEARFQRLHTEFGALEKRFPAVENRPPLFGLPIGVKDIFRVDGFATQAGSRLPPTTFAGREAVSVSQLKQAGGLVLGKTVTTEFAYFASGPTRNPHHPGHTPGGSSSGSAAAVAAGLAPTALGTQTIGSINRPAAFCGVVGFKPSFGRIPTQGVIPLSASYDTVGFFTQEVEATRLVASILLADWRPAALSHKPVLGVPVGPYLEMASTEGRAHLDRVVDQLRRADFRVVEVPAMPDYFEIAERHHRVLAAEAAEVHQEWFGEFEPLYHPKTAELIRRGQAIGPTELTAARAGGRELRAELSRLMEQAGLHVWLSPSAVGPAPEGLESTGDPALNLPWTHAGLPTLSLPTGRSDGGLPLGTQLTGGWQQDEQLLEYAASIESIVRER